MACTGTWISTHAKKACPLISDDTHTIGGTFYCHDVVNDLSAVTAQHDGNIAHQRQAINQLIVCARKKSMTAAYFEAPFAQGESQGIEKWHRLSLFLLREVFEAAEACKEVSVQGEDPNFF